MSPVAIDVTAALEAWSRQEPGALNDLYDLIYQDLRRTAQRYMAHERPDHTLQATSLVNEVYLRMHGRRKVTWKNRAQFFTFAGETMRQVLVDHARRRLADKRFDRLERVPLTGCDEAVRQIDAVAIIDLDKALTEFSKIDPRAVTVVNLCYFSGLNQKEAAKALGISLPTVQRDWKAARQWLRVRLRDPSLLE